MDLRGRVNEIREFEGSSVLWYMADGHVPPVDFVAELEREFQMAALEEDVEHIYIRNVPAGGRGDGMVMYLADGPGRGAYKATILDVSE